MTKVHLVRKEYDEPFRDVVSGFASMGYSKTFTAKTLGINRSYFRSLLDRYAPKVQWPKQRDMVEGCKGQGKGWEKGRPRGFRHSDKELLELVRKHKTAANLRRNSSVSDSTIRSRFGTWKEALRMAYGQKDL